MEYKVITDRSSLPDIANRIERADAIGLDLETTSLDPRFGKIRLMQISLPGEGNGGRCDIFVIDVFETRDISPITDSLNNSKTIVIAHNAKFEQKWLWWHYRVHLWPVFCTYRASAIVYNGKAEYSHDLDSVVMQELDEFPENTGQGASNWGGVLSKRQLDYAAEDVLRLRDLRVALKKKLVEYSLNQAALIEFSVIEAEARCELNGFCLDSDRWMSLAEKNKVEKSRLSAELLSELPHPKNQLALPGMTPDWNLESSQQMVEVLRKMGVKSKIKDEEGRYKSVPLTGTMEIELAQHVSDFQIISKILDYRGVSQLVKTYGEKYLRHVDQDGRVHPEYHGLLLTARYSASKGVQTIPKSKEFRDCFRCVEGRKLALADYAGIEMRLGGEISNDAALIDVFARGLDAHTATASAMTGVPYEQVTPDERRKAKPVNFGFIYGMMEEKLVLYALSLYKVILSIEEARMYRKNYFEKYRGIGDYHRRILRDGKRLGFSRSMSGRIRYLSDDAHNEHLNTPIQMTGADGLKRSLGILQKRLDAEFGVTAACTPDGPAQIVHHVHDEIIVESDDDRDMLDAVKKCINEAMIEGMSVYLKKIPVVVDASEGYSWAEAK